MKHLYYVYRRDRWVGQAYAASALEAIDLHIRSSEYPAPGPYMAVLADEASRRGL